LANGGSCDERLYINKTSKVARRLHTGRGKGPLPAAAGSGPYDGGRVWKSGWRNKEPASEGGLYNYTSGGEGDVDDRYGKMKYIGGAVAQLGARLDGIEEVEGSNPFGSTKNHPAFRNRFFLISTPD
jgi:hypothetical protein